MLRHFEGEVDHLSLDHDLGISEKDGYYVLTWIEDEMHYRGYSPPLYISVHSANPAGVQRMNMAIRSINENRALKVTDTKT